MNYKIRIMKREEVDLAVEWAAGEGWSPGLNDAGCFYAADPKGFFIGLLGNAPVACISAVAYDRNFGFLGFYLVKSRYRGRGYGIRIWREAISYLTTQNIGLDGVLAQQENYEKSGFKPAYRNIRYRGISSTQKAEFPDIVELNDLNFTQIDNYDRNFFPAARTKFLKHWISQPESLALGVEKNRRLSGYGVIRRCRSGYKIGPLFAESQSTAERLFMSLGNFAGENEQIFLDVPEVNKFALDLAKNHKMEKVFETVRMYTRGEPVLPMEKIYGVTSFELG